MELAAAALSSLLPKLAALLTDEYKLQKGVRGEIKFLKAEMESMQAALNRVSQLPPQQIDELHKIWVRDLKELSYDIEDSVDSFMLRVDVPGSAKTNSFRRFFDRTIRLLTKAKARHQIADDIQDIKSRIHEVAGRRERYKFPEVAVQPENTEIDPRLPALYEDVKNLVGIEGPAKKLTTLLMHGKGAQKQQLMVVSIVGVGGLGKTTLANTVYQRLRGDFQAQAFVSVSLKPDINKIFSSILRQVSGDQYPNAEAWSHTEVIDKIRQVLEKKRYIIVIDDVWSEFAWTQIKCALIENSLGSRVIVTTRNADVAKFSCSSIDDTMCELDPLSYENSKKLLCTRVFNENEEMHSELEEVSRKILEKCGGIPLAIITTASLLASRRPNKTKYEWYGVYSSMGSGLHKDKSLENMRGILYLSYSDLPSYLKPCLLYLSMFPEDYEIASDDLVRLWIAEGFIDEKQGSNLYDLGEMYLNALANRSLIQPIYDKYGSPRACRVHDMVLDLIMSISAQENFVTILEEPCLTSSACNIRRLSLRGSRTNSNKGQMIFPETENTSHVRSIIAFGNALEWWPPMSRFPVLRVLDLKDTERDSSIHLKDLGSLQHLRHLELGYVLSTEILEGIGNLTKLRVLRIQGFNFNLNQSYMKTFLQALSNLANLRTVVLIGDITNIFFSDCTPHQWTAPVRLHHFIGEYIIFSQVPWWFSSLNQLSSLSIWVNLLRQEDLDLLGALPVLRFLKLYVSKSEKQLVVGAGYPFQSLAEFMFCHRRICWLEFALGVMPKLQRLELLVAAREAGGFGIGLDNLGSLEDATINVSCEGARIEEVEDVEDNVRDEIERHPNHPMLNLSRWRERGLIVDEDEEDEEYEESEDDDSLEER